MNVAQALALFDFDGTMISGDSIVSYTRFALKTGRMRWGEYARAGLPIVLLDSNISRVYGSDVTADAEAAAAFAAMAGLENVRVIAAAEEIPAALEALGVTAWAQYEAAHLETTMYWDAADGTNYYYVYNN